MLLRAPSKQILNGPRNGAATVSRGQPVPMFHHLLRKGLVWRLQTRKFLNWWINIHSFRHLKLSDSHPNFSYKLSKILLFSAHSPQKSRKHWLRFTRLWVRFVSWSCKLCGKFGYRVYCKQRGKKEDPSSSSAWCGYALVTLVAPGSCRSQEFMVHWLLLDGTWEGSRVHLLSGARDKQIAFWISSSEDFNCWLQLLCVPRGLKCQTPMEAIEVPGISLCI